MSLLARMSRGDRRERTRQASAWVSARAGRPIRYGLFARLSDRMQGNRDGHLGLPSADADFPATPVIRTLVSAFDGAHHDELQRIERDIAAWREEVGTRQAQLVTARSELHRLEAKVRSMPESLSADDLKQRRPGETDTDETIVRGRRTRAHEQRRAALDARIDALRAQAHQLDAEVQRIEEAVLARRTIGAVRVARLHAYTERRIATYHRRLLRVHPDAARLAAILPSTNPRLPPWADELVPASPEPVKSACALRPAAEGGSR